MTATSERRLPDFLIIGASKSGTTSLFRWLGAQEEIHSQRVKEPHFFSDEKEWDKGMDYYAGYFREARRDQLTGEASVSYTNPEKSTTAASRIKQVLPSARLIFVARDPLERLRSHYRHQVQRGRERRPFAEAVQDDAYVARSQYHHCLEPYFDRFPQEQICVVRFEDLISQDTSGWSKVLGFIGLDYRPAPQKAHNVTSEKAGFRLLMRYVWNTPAFRLADRLPSAVRRFGRWLLLRDDRRYRALLASSGDPVPNEVARLIWKDVDRLEERLEIGHGKMWDRQPV